MPRPFDVITDKAGKIEHFTPHGLPDEIAPEHIGEHLDGGERIKVSGTEYSLTEQGSLISLDVEVPGNVLLGYGVRLGMGTKFGEPDADKNPDKDQEIVVFDRTRIEGTKIAAGVMIGRGAVIRAASIGPDTQIDDYTRIRENTAVQSGVTIGKSVRIAREVSVFTGVTIKDRVHIGHATALGQGAVVHADAKIGVREDGRDRTGSNQGGIYVTPGTVVAAHSFR